MGQQLRVVNTERVDLCRRFNQAISESGLGENQGRVFRVVAEFSPDTLDVDPEGRRSIGGVITPDFLRQAAVSDGIPDVFHQVTQDDIFRPGELDRFVPEVYQVKGSV